MSRYSITRRRFLHGGSLVLGGLAAAPTLSGLVACRRPGEAPGTRPPLGPDADAATGPGELAASSEPGPAPVEAAPPPPDPRLGLEPRLDLLEHLHLADVDHHGLFVDFGEPGRSKYTLGGWRTGWGEDGREGETAFTYATASPARLYFHLERPGPLSLVLRARPGRVDRVTAYVNDRPVGSIGLPAGWSEHTVAVETAATRAGENSLKLVHSGRAERTNAFAVDWLRVVPGARAPLSGEGFRAPTALGLVAPPGTGGLRGASLRLRSPTRLSWFLELPEAVGLGFAAAPVGERPVRVAVTVTDASRGEARRLHEETVRAGEGPRPALVDLGALGGEVVRLDIEVAAEGEDEDGEVLLESPALLAREARVTSPAPAEARNVVLVLVDTLRADRLGLYHRATRVETPAMEAFAAGATLFERCQAPGNWTKPSCASLLTGLHPPSHRALTEGNSLPRSVTMVSELFRQAGFRTGAFIANGYLAADFGFDRGWDHYRNYIRERVPTEAEHVYRDALEWMERGREGRSFAYVHAIDPHVPYDPPPDDLRRYDPAPYSGPVRNRSTGYLLEDIKAGRVELSDRDRARLVALYDGEVTYHDRFFGRFLERLDELGLADSTLVAVTSDHGEEFFEHGSVGHGHSLHQELLHVPLLFRVPGLGAVGRRLGQACSLVDVSPTLLEAAGLPVPEVMEGRSLLPDLRGAPPPPLGAAFSSQWDTGNNWELGWTARVSDWKLRMHGPGIAFLHELRSDRLETRDVDDDHPIALRAARVLLGQFLGASERRSWARPVARRRRPSPEHRAEDAAMSPELCEQLRALGYLDVAECGR